MKKYIKISILTLILSGCTSNTSLLENGASSQEGNLVDVYQCISKISCKDFSSPPSNLVGYNFSLVPYENQEFISSFLTKALFSNPDIISTYNKKHESLFDGCEEVFKSYGFEKIDYNQIKGYMLLKQNKPSYQKYNLFNLEWKRANLAILSVDKDSKNTYVNLLIESTTKRPLSSFYTINEEIDQDTYKLRQTILNEIKSKM